MKLDPLRPSSPPRSLGVIPQTGYIQSFLDPNAGVDKIATMSTQLFRGLLSTPRAGVTLRAA
ncbi:hypothetical protein GCM10009655_02940 [Rhodoglobus aureus]|uniref:Uncharacterized protein n=1 Tax=Rhodoglobus aureus TaxID=191497 RepID=A0ABN1VDY4_9MICO